MWTSFGPKPAAGNVTSKKVGRFTRVTSPSGWMLTVGTAKSVSWNASLIIAIVSALAAPGSRSGKHVMP